MSWALAALFMVVGGTLPWTEAAPLGWMVGWFAVAFLLVQFIRMAVHRLLRSAAGAVATRRIALVGAPESACTLERLIAGHALGYNVVGTVFCHPRRGVAGSRGNEDFRRLVDLVRSERVDQVIVALPWTAADSIRGIVSALRCVSVDIRLAPEQLSGLRATAGYTSVGGTPMLRLADRPLCPWQRMAKTVADTVVAATALAFLAPLMVLIAAAIRLDSPGPVLFGQTRRGLNGALIRLWKFRTMYHHLRDDDAAQLAMRHDPRVTRVGRFLRRSSLDEIPQLFNVLTGGMSIVGPRPHPLSAKAAGRLYAEIVEDYEDRHRVKPGITGWAQVNGWRGETDCAEKIQKRVEFDPFYIENWSLGLDVRILFMTILAVLRGDNAY